MYAEAKDVGYSWTMSVKIISSGEKLERVVSLSHPIDVALSEDGKEAMVTISKEKLAKAGLKEVPDRDYILLYRDSSVGVPSILLQKSGEEFTAMVSFFPDFLNDSHKANIRSSIKKKLG